MTDTIRKPDFFIVGAPKCGTTAMNDYLKQHPEIFMSELKELHFFGTDLNLKRPENLSKEKYLSFFKETKGEKRIGEASVWYLYSKKAALEIKNFTPSATIIIMLRNPVDMIYSLHNQMLYNGNENIADFQAALEAEGERKRGLRIPDTAMNIKGLFYRETVKYTQQVRRYLDVFGADKVHIIIYDDFKRVPEDVFRRTLEFLQVDSKIHITFDVINPNKTIRWPALRTLWHSRRVRWIRGGAHRFLPRSFFKYYSSLNTVYVPRQPMDPALRNRLQIEFTPEIEQLSELLGRDLTYWSKS